MATKSFLSANDTEEALRIIKPPLHPPSGDEAMASEISSEFSLWLGERLHDRLKSHPDWSASEPIALGSWSRDELAPKSDIDMLFGGPEDRVKKLVQDFSKEGLKLRYRVPEDADDWTKGVEPFDVLALFNARGLTPEAQRKLEIQKSKLENRKRQFRASLLKAMQVERRARADRYDSIANFLQPNLKYGGGGLRDLEQALMVRQLFSERFNEESRHSLEVLMYYKKFFLLLRQKLQLSEGSGEVLAAPEQKPLAEWFKFSDPKDFMREIQKGLSRVSFYADWTLEQASRSRAKIKAVEDRKLESVSSLFKALNDDPSLLMQSRVRLASDKIFAKVGRARKDIDELIGRELTKILDPERDEETMVAFFRSRLIDHCVPEFKRIIGHVQHDQYHRYSVDAHLLQVLREMKRIRKNPKRAGKLAGLVKGISKKEWEILSFAGLYHDIAKGRGGDHAEEGVEVATKDLKRFAKSDQFIEEVTWIVNEHLSLSVAAFRENSQSPRTWRALAEKGATGRRLHMLTVFTIVDICGTNPEAWTPWKERLLYELVLQLEKPETDSMLGFVRALRAAKLHEFEDELDNLDPFLIAAIPPKVIVEDLKDLKKSSSDLPVRVVRLKRGGQTWIRFHSREDRPGLFLGFVRWLAIAGLSVRHASIHTDSHLGVYDWFEVKSEKQPAQIQKLLTAASYSSVTKTYEVSFDAIEIISRDEKEWVVSFRGRDQSGALSEAARVLFEEGAEIRWAKVHTWGRQIDDIFGIGAQKNVRPEDFASKILLKIGPKT